MEFYQLLSLVEKILVVTGLWPLDKEAPRDQRIRCICYAVRAVFVACFLLSNMNYLLQNVRYLQEGEGSAFVKSVATCLIIVLFLSICYVGKYKYAKTKIWFEQMAAYNCPGNRYVLLTLFLLLAVSSGRWYSCGNMLFQLMGNWGPIMEKQIRKSLSKTEFEAYVYILARLIEPIQFVLNVPVVIIFLMCMIVQKQYKILNSQLKGSNDSKEIYEQKSDTFSQIQVQHNKLRNTVDSIDNTFYYFIIMFCILNVFYAFAAVYLYTANCITGAKSAVYLINVSILLLILCSDGAIISKAVSS